MNKYTTEPVLIELYDNHNYIWAHAVFHGTATDSSMHETKTVY